ncbi:protein C19orf12-like isoform X2 [Tyto alba]|uniref:protein C19orf12-like isoform X2 n=1 Tax=Tyto alba TaxID=56313 RepID=UPI001C66328D|nr:protein C19orf12-like isoform X2 [Tyto alba]
MHVTVTQGEADESCCQRLSCRSTAGGVFGGLIGARMTAPRFKPLPQILWELSPAEKQKFYSESIVILECLQWTDIDELTALVMGNAGLQEKLTILLTEYLSKELGIKIQYQQ